MKVVIHVMGGIAECVSAPDGIDVEILDFDSYADANGKMAAYKLQEDTEQGCTHPRAAYDTCGPMPDGSTLIYCGICGVSVDDNPGG